MSNFFAKKEGVVGVGGVARQVDEGDSQGSWAI